MASSIEELYRAVIMDHAKNPKNKGLSIDINIQHIPTNLSSLIMYILMNIINNFSNRSI